MFSLLSICIPSAVKITDNLVLSNMCNKPAERNYIQIYMNLPNAPLN